MCFKAAGEAEAAASDGRIVQGDDSDASCYMRPVIVRQNMVAPHTIPMLPYAPCNGVRIM
jgi:hypothetical protein